MTILSAPCKGCPDRTIIPNCHDPERCPRWAAFRAQVDADQAEKNRIWRGEYDYNRVVESGIQRMKSKGGRKRK